METKRRIEIVNSYGKTLESCPFSVSRNRDLPFDKGLIRRALIETLLDNGDAQLRDHLKVAFLSLEMFVSDEEFDIVSRHEASVKEIACRMETEGPGAVRDFATAPYMDKYLEILGRVQIEQEQAMSCLRRLLSESEGNGLR